MGLEFGSGELGLSAGLSQCLVLLCSCLFNPQSTWEIHILVPPDRWNWSQRPKWLSQCHTANMEQSWAPNINLRWLFFLLYIYTHTKKYPEAGQKQVGLRRAADPYSQIKCQYLWCLAGLVGRAWNSWSWVMSLSPMLGAKFTQTKKKKKKIVPKRIWEESRRGLQ